MRKFLILPLLLMFAAIGFSACTAFGLRPAPTPTLDTAHWKVYQDLDQHFSFQYPKSYDDRPLCALKVQPADDSSPTFSVFLNNNNLKVSLTPLDNPKDTDPQSAVTELRNYWSQSTRVSFDDPVKLTVAGIPALAQRYHTVYSKDGYVEDVFLKKNGILYTISLSTPATCDGYPDTPTALEAYQRILSSLKIQ